MLRIGSDLCGAACFVKQIHALDRFLGDLGPYFAAGARCAKPMAGPCRARGQAVARRSALRLGSGQATAAPCFRPRASAPDGLRPLARHGQFGSGVGRGRFPHNPSYGSWVARGASLAVEVAERHPLNLIRFVPA